MKKFFTICCCACIALTSLADSPLTSTFFAMAYNDVPTIGTIMQKRMSEGVYNVSLTPEYLAFLDNATIPLDQKIALINGLGWGETGNTEVYIQHLMDKYALTHDVFDSLMVFRDNEVEDLWPAATVIDNHDLLSLAYMHALGDYFDVAQQANIAYYVYAQIQDSQAAACVSGLLVSQIMLDLNWCAVYLALEETRTGTYSKDLLRPAALSAIYEYIDLYAASCLEAETDMEYGEQTQEGIGKMVTSLSYYTEHPAYEIPAVRQLSNKEDKIDLCLMNEKKVTIHENWITYNAQADGTDLLVMIKNKGNTESIGTNVLIHIFKDENVEGDVDYYLQSDLPVIGAGKTIELTITLREYWIYDPNAHFEIILDYDNNIEESNEDNNTQQFFEQG